MNRLISNLHKEHNSIITKDLKGKISFLRLIELKKIKKKLFLNNPRYFLILGKSIDVIIKLKGYRKRNEIFALTGDYKKIIIFDYDGNILKIIHEGTKNYIKNFEYCQSFNCFLYLGISRTLIQILLIVILLVFLK